MFDISIHNRILLNLRQSLTIRPEQLKDLPQNTLSFQTTLEATQAACNTVHKIWAMVELNAIQPCKLIPKIPLDFVIVIDHSSSMRTNNKIAFVQATIEYMISKLEADSRFCLIKFNHEVSFVTSGLLQMTPENKSKVLELLKEIKPEGSTNISDSLFAAINLLKSRELSEQNRISSVMLFTGNLFRFVRIRWNGILRKIV
jgi:Mg-chelatase subunit ChlD